jgi:hypothetical protein
MKASDLLKEKFPDISGILPELTGHLMINGSMVFFSGLLHGKLGISLFFFHCGRYAKNPLYDEYARYLVDLAMSQIHDDYPLDYERGLAGVGTGLDYLKKYGYFDAGDDYMNHIDSKIIRAVGYERRTDMLTGFGRYLLSRYGSKQAVKDSLIQLAGLLTEYLEPVPADTISLLCDLYLLGIARERTKPYVSVSTHALIRAVQKEPVSAKLFTLIRISRVFSCGFCRQAAHDALCSIFTGESVQFTGISDLQWLIQCEKLVNDKDFHSFLPEVQNSIAKNTASLNLSQPDELFSGRNDFAFQGGYAGLGLALISLSGCGNTDWINLLQI